MGCKAALIADVGIMAGVVQTFAQCMKDFRPNTHGLGERFRSHRHDHEFLEINRVVRVCTAIDDIHHRHRQDMRIRTAKISVDRQPACHCRGLGDRERYAKDGVGAEPLLGWRPVKITKDAIYAQLIFCFELLQRIEYLAIDRIDGLAHALPEITFRIAVAQLVRLKRAGRRAGGNARAAHGTIFQYNVDLDGWIAATVKNFTPDYFQNRCHMSVPSDTQSELRECDRSCEDLRILLAESRLM